MLCRAKVNLTLHVGAAIGEGQFSGYHPIESLVVFADFGDRLSFEPSRHELSIRFTGAFGEEMSGLTHTSVEQALTLCDAPPQHVTLEKNLPLAAGLGGGTADAAGVLRTFDPTGRIDALKIGADGPVCRLSRTTMMEGIGERLTPLPGLGRLAGILVNPGVGVSTAGIFRALDSGPRPAEPSRTGRNGSLLDRAMSGVNDMEAAAIDTQPVIREVLDTVAATSGCVLSRMSGSGATCFGLYETMDTAERAAKALSDRGWWVRSTWLGDVD